MEASEQSAINFLIMFEPPKDNYYEMFGDDHEVFKIKGGSQQLSDALYNQVKEQVVLKHQLVAINKNKKAGYDLLLKNNDETKTTHADYVLLAIPFTILRKIKMNIEMPAAKKKMH